MARKNKLSKRTQKRSRRAVSTGGGSGIGRFSPKHALHTLMGRLSAKAKLLPLIRSRTKKHILDAITGSTPQKLAILSKFDKQQPPIYPIPYEDKALIQKIENISINKNSASNWKTVGFLFSVNDTENNCNNFFINYMNLAQMNEFKAEEIDLPNDKLIEWPTASLKASHLGFIVGLAQPIREERQLPTTLSAMNINELKPTDIINVLEYLFRELKLPNDFTAKHIVAPPTTTIGSGTNIPSSQAHQLLTSPGKINLYKYTDLPAINGLYPINANFQNILNTGLNNKTSSNNESSKAKQILISGLINPDIANPAYIVYAYMYQRSGNIAARPILLKLNINQSMSSKFDFEYLDGIKTIDDINKELHTPKTNNTHVILIGKLARYNKCHTFPDTRFSPPHPIVL